MLTVKLADTQQRVHPAEIRQHYSFRREQLDSGLLAATPQRLLPQLTERKQARSGSESRASDKCCVRAALWSLHADARLLLFVCSKALVEVEL